MVRRLNWDMNPYLFSGLENGPLVLERLVGKLDGAQLDKPSSPDRFSPREVVAHMADWEPILLARIHQAVERPDSLVEVYDEGEMAVAHDYAHSDIGVQMGKFKDARKATIEYLKGLDGAAWDKSVKHPERGVMTVHDMASMFLGHDIYHIEQLSSAF